MLLATELGLGIWNEPGNPAWRLSPWQRSVITGQKIFLRLFLEDPQRRGPYQSGKKEARPLLI